MKKVVSTILMVLIIIMFSNLPVYAMGFTINLTPSKSVGAPGGTISVTISLGNLNIGEDGTSVFTGFLKYDTEVFEEISQSDIKGLNNWQVTYSSENGQIVLQNSNMVKTDSDLCVINFKIKSEITKTTTDIKLEEPQTTNKKIDIIGTEGKLTISLKQLSSEEYEIGEDNIIKGVSANTSISDFKGKLDGGGTLKIEDKNGNEITSGNVGTAYVVKTESGEKYTIIVTGDINGDGKLSTTDLSKLKSHIVESETLVAPYKTAADMNNDGKISPTDLSKLVALVLGKV